jgi:malonyl-CoA O-methyltransferase
VDKSDIARSFGSASHTYDAHAELQRSIGASLLGSASPNLCVGSVILDVGSGTGHFSRYLAGRYPSSRVISLDISEGMLRVHATGGRGASHPIVGDAERLPIATGVVDFVFSNLAIQWCSSQFEAISEFFRILKPGGTLRFSTFGQETLKELRSVWHEVDGYSHVNDFEAFENLRGEVSSIGFEQVSLEQGHVSVPYSDPMSLMRELKGIGAHNLNENRPRHLTRKSDMKAVLAGYPMVEKGGDKFALASYEVIYGFCAK